MTGDKVMLCGVCATSLRFGARFCTRCGAEQGVMIARDVGAGAALREPSPRPIGERLHIGGRGLTVALAAYFAMLVPLVALIGGGFSSLSDMLTAELWIGVVGVIGMAVMWRDTLPLLGRPRFTVRQLGLTVAGIGGVVVLVQSEAWMFPELFLETTLPYRLEGKGLGYALLHAAVVPAIVEELAFRGVVLTALTAMFRERTALLMSSMMFAILHLSPIAFVHLTLLGLLCGTARLRTGSIWPCVAIHLAYNAVVIALAW